MAKLWKKARKFAKKNLQSVLKRKRKMNALFKKKASKRVGAAVNHLGLVPHEALGLRFDSH
ncbi:hypothetical protein TorRG33x02_204860 [Trema orientale]|uniref:Uncharacterized protein n=1 Tax=Trema orientale TaxID=63057 RepID=A0A2P5EDS8_TREOI|nr:hypothetical protein TorRG33x02_204860 [Trema orientale]